MPGDVPARLYKTGVQVAREAVDADNAREFQQALDLYKKSAEFFVAGLRADQQLQQQQRQRQIEKWGRALRPNRINKDRRKIRMNFISGKVSEFLDRAEKIHAFLKSHVAANQQPEKELTPLDAKSIDDIFKGVIGAEAAKQALLEAVYLPQKFPSVFADGRAPWSGVLLFGPPGTGKTELASAVARHNNCHFVSVSAADMVSKYQGESARNVAKLFDNARRQKGPTVIFLDEIDALGTSRADGESSDIRQVKNELLRQLDGFSSKSKRLSSEVHVTASAPLWQFCNCGIPSVSVQRFESTLLWNAVLPHARVQSRFFVQQTIPGRWTRLCYGGFSREFMSLCRVLESEPHLLLILFGMNHTHFNRKTLAGLLLERRDIQEVICMSLYEKRSCTQFEKHSAPDIFETWAMLHIQSLCRAARCPLVHGKQECLIYRRIQSYYRR
eukprot:INCI6185.2.p1 GENE.INCI6185.2~~INCI6185.2.p1  ORF type:complete len:486 (+),score=74.98 INCI6185.2:131-1459(+)